jgi:hypothetical protein
MVRDARQTGYAAAAAVLFLLSRPGIAEAEEAAVPPAPANNSGSPTPEGPRAASPEAQPPSAPPSGPPPQVTYPPVAERPSEPMPDMEEPPRHSSEDSESHPLFGLNGALGLAFGGDNLITATFADGSTRDLPAGRGVILSVGAMATPLWAGPVGLGLGVDIGVKYTSISASNGTASFTRFPLVLSAHALFDVTHHWYILAAGGLHHELGVSLTGDGLFSGLSADFDSNWGGMAELGAFYAKKHLGASGTIRYTSARYFIAGQTFDASNVGVFGVIHYNFL